MTAEVRKALRTSEEESAKEALVPIGGRLSRVRQESGLSQAALAKELGTTLKTYGRWERGVREISVEGLAGLANRGWNVNWLLTGEGAERLDQDAAAVPESQFERQGRVRIAVQLLREAEDAAGVPPRWTPEQQGEATAILVRLLEIGTATAEVRSIAEQQIRLFSGGKRDGRPGSGAEGVGR